MAPNPTGVLSMNRYTALLFALVAVTACSSDTNKAADTTAAISVADTTVSTVEAASTTPTSGDAVIVPVNINTATDAEILRIPGVGPRMLREFKEYRPWTSIEQFRREIGKYVDKAEVARLEKYIVIK
jgi:DNA uptake protein ComE-like DNA-binding protein